MREPTPTPLSASSSRSALPSCSTPLFDAQYAQAAEEPALPRADACVGPRQHPRRGALEDREVRHLRLDLGDELGGRGAGPDHGHPPAGEVEVVVPARRMDSRPELEVLGTPLEVAPRSPAASSSGPSSRGWARTTAGRNARPRRKRTPDSCCRARCRRRHPRARGSAAPDDGDARLHPSIDRSCEAFTVSQSPPHRRLTRATAGGTVPAWPVPGRW